MRKRRVRGKLWFPEGFHASKPTFFDRKHSTDSITSSTPHSDIESQNTSDDSETERAEASALQEWSSAEFLEKNDEQIVRSKVSIFI